MSILLLPAELVEHILVSAAATGFPHAIASFSQTCKANYELVYNPTDQHLWREIFLTTFDDPRASGGGPGWRECLSSRDQSHDNSLDWGAEFRKRIWAADYIRRRSTSTHLDQEELDTPQLQANTRAFDILLSVVATALPCPPTIVFSFLPPDKDSPQSTARVQGDTYPTFPPLPQAIGGFSTSIVTAAPPDANGRAFGDSLRARNPAWLDALLKDGLPPDVTRLISGDKWVGGLSDQFLTEPEFGQMQAAGHLIACLGFTPTPQKSTAISRSSPSSPVETPEGEGETTTPLPGNEGEREYESPERQLKRARRLARMRVYNMRYLARDRHWGPFLAPSGKKKSVAGAEGAADDDLIQPILALFRGTPQFPDMDGEDDESAAGEEEEGSGSGSSGGDNDEGHTTSTSGDDGDDEGADEQHDEDAEHAEGRDTDTLTEPPSADQLRADWAYLAAVRVVVQLNLRDSVPHVDLRSLFSLDGLRAGSAPWDASAYKRAEEDSQVVTTSANEKGKGKAMDENEVEGWDWAGVNGVWKRCVCWMDYRDLILHNLSGEFEDPHLEEAVRIVTMRLRVKSYSRSEVPEYAHLPTIHVEGETTGSSVGPRRMHGTVCVIADGSVRWTLYSTVEGSSTTDEWVSESVQVGGVASAMGLLGIWTGANHERMDPLGPTWAWKVG